MSFDFKLPQIQGTDPSVQISSIQTYLYQLVEQLNHSINALDRNITETTETVIASKGEKTRQTTEKEAQASFDAVKGLIIKSAEIVNAYYQKMKIQFDGIYTAQSDFGTFVERTDTAIELANDGIEVNTQAIGVINTNITTINGEISDLDSSVDSLETTTGGLTTRMQIAESNITTNANAITTKVAQTEYDTDMQSVETALGQKASAQDLTNLTGRVSSAESTITQQASQIALRVTTTTYEQGISDTRDYASSQASSAETSAKGYADTQDASTLATANSNAQSYANTAESSAKTYSESVLNTFKTGQYAQDISDLQSQIDHNTTSWFYDYAPTLNNLPASDWVTTTIKDNHIGDLFYNTSAGYTYHFVKTGSNYSWERIKDEDITSAMSAASTAQDTADHKRRVFVSQPVTPYDVGDLWTNGTDLKKCKTARSSGAYTASDWELATNDKAYADSAASTAQSNAISAAASDATSKANTAQANAISTASSDATSKMNSAISTAASDATSKANAAQSAAEATASADATSKANAALTSANAYTDVESSAASIIPKINESSLTISGDRVDIQSDNIHLEGYTSINNGFSVDLNGNITTNDATMHNATIDGDIFFPNSTSKIVGGQGLYSTLNFVSKRGRYCAYDTGYEEPLDINPYKDYIYIDAYIPPNFVVVSAYVTLIHQPHSASGQWYGGGVYPEPYSNVVGYARQIALYKITNAGRETYVENSGDYQPTEPSGTEITSAFGSNGWTPSNTSDISMISTSDIASAIGLTVGANNRFAFMTKQTRPSESTTITQFRNNIIATHSNLEAILTVNGYTSV